MKAVVCTKYGPPEVLKIKDIPKPVPKENEVLIKIHASSVSAGDVRIRSFTYARWFWLFGKLLFGITKPRKIIPGDEFAGEIEATGRNVENFKTGDQVFGMSDSFGFGGGNAEYKCLSQNAPLTTVPSNLTWEQAAVVPFGGLTALHFLRKGNVKEGQDLLVDGASGSVGTYAVQPAKYFGVTVTGVCSGSNIDLVESLGADHVIDYTEEDFTKNGKTYDAIYDTVGKTTFSRCKSSRKPGGRFITDDWPLFEVLPTLISGDKKIIFGIPNQKEIVDGLVFLRQLLMDGKLMPVIDTIYPLDKIVDAHRYVETGHKKGNVVITVE